MLFDTIRPYYHTNIDVVRKGKEGAIQAGYCTYIFHCVSILQDLSSVTTSSSSHQPKASSSQANLLFETHQTPHHFQLIQSQTPKMKTSVILAAVGGLASSVSAASGQYFSVIAVDSATPIHLRPITANGESLWIGKKTSSVSRPIG